ncbi:transcription factor HES-4-B-like [Astyanax mexicanus]|uniref:Transcription factor HES-4-B-like n=1 Tax=Astyanax mexicanus TaxID=7994 RepID=A0A8T2LDC3_ASTMX|nr:transcription factor HES-4-B-like [Astyanax mexicanus]
MDFGGEEVQQTVRTIIKSQSEKNPQRRLSKPLLERRRRARINACLGELRSLLLQSHATQGCHPSKLEKADILELTVRHLRSLQHTHSGGNGVFCVGYSACVCEIRRFLCAAPQTVNRPDAGGALLQGISVCPAQTTQKPSLSQHTHHTHQHLHLSTHQEKTSSSSSGTYSSVWRPW